MKISDPLTHKKDYALSESTINVPFFQTATGVQSYKPSAFIILLLRLGILQSAQSTHPTIYYQSRGKFKCRCSIDLSGLKSASVNYFGSTRCIL